VPDDTTVEALAEAYLAESLSAPKRIKYRTFESGVKPGMSQHITRAMRNLDDDVLITDVVIKDYGTARLVRDVSATTGTSLKSRWRDVVKTWSGDKTGGAAMLTPTLGAAGPSGAAAAPPIQSFQFNRMGALGAIAGIYVEEDETSVVIGDPIVSSVGAITAADFSHCLIVGPYCEITDP
jgi:hypothetical protein